VGNKVFAGTLGARFDMTDLGKDPMYHEETSRHLLGLTGYTSGYIHWAFGTASVDQHGMPSSYKRPSPPSKIGTAMLLDKEILEAILVSQIGRSTPDRYPQHATASPQLLEPRSSIHLSRTYSRRPSNAKPGGEGDVALHLLSRTRKGPR